MAAEANKTPGFIARFGWGRLAAVGGAAAGVAAVLSAIVLNLGGAPKSLLYSNLDLKEAGQITQALDQAGVKYEVKGDGSTIMVDRDKVGSTRLLLSGKGLPTSADLGYALLDTQQALGQTEATQNLNQKRALEGELAKTIRSLHGVTSAKVLLALPQRQLFQEDAAAPTASVTIGLQGNDPAAEQVQAIRNLVASAVPNLKPENVTIVDDKNRLLAAGADGEGASSQVAASRKAEIEDQMRKRLKDLVEGVVGPGKARITVTADVDATRVTKQEEKFDPDGQVVRSTKTTTASDKKNETNPSGATTASANIPAATPVGAGNGTNGSDSNQNEEQTNYEISKTVTTQTTEPGSVKNLSVSVAVDGVTTAGAGGKTSYAPRSAEDMKHIEDLVRAAAGINDTRGDKLAVVNIRFNREGDAMGGTTAPAPMFAFDKNDIMRGVELGILAIVAILIIFFVVKPMLTAASGPISVRTTGPLLAGATAGGGDMAMAGGAPALAGPAGGALPSQADVDARLDIARIEGQVKASSVKRVAEFIDRHPEESVALIRNWLHE